MAKSEAILNKLMLDIAKEQNFVNYALIIEPISSGGANYTSTLYNVTLTEGDRCVHMFAKVAAVGEAMRSQAPKFYQTENFFYTQLLKLYDRLQDEQQVPEEHRLIFPKFYGSNTEVYEETIVLENLVEEGYQSYDRFKSIEWDYAKSAVTNLAKLHALSYAYGEYYPTEFNKIAGELKFEFDMSSEMMAGYFKNILAQTFSNTVEENREKLQKFFETFEMESYFEMYLASGRRVLGHGDYRPSNLMHKIREVSFSIYFID